LEAVADVDSVRSASAAELTGASGSQQCQHCEQARCLGTVTVPGVDVQRFHNALATDPDARTRLGGGSINEDGSLVLVAADEDAEVAKRVVAVSGAELDTSGVRHGTSRFVP
jgi:hypothetical protein